MVMNIGKLLIMMVVVMKQWKSRGDISGENGEQQQIKVNRKENIDVRLEYMFL
jgi:hypothetical protein